MSSYELPIHTRIFISFDVMKQQKSIPWIYGREMRHKSKDLWADGDTYTLNKHKCKSLEKQVPNAE